MTAEDTPDTPRDFKTRLRVLYTGWSRHSARFRYALLTFDLFTVAFFILTAPVASKPWVHGIELGLGVIILADFVARFWISERRWHHATRLWVMADALVLASIFLHTLLPVDLSFLRVLRLLRIGHSPELMIDLRRVSTWFRLRDDAMLALVNLVTFVLTMATMIFVFFIGEEYGYSGYVDAIYFTVATLTTTGFGDLVPSDPLSKLLTVIMMIVGVSLFVQLARAVMKPAKVKYLCQSCGLNRHDPDAVHCKHCGAMVHIKTEGQH